MFLENTRARKGKGEGVKLLVSNTEKENYYRRSAEDEVKMYRETRTRRVVAQECGNRAKDASSLDMLLFRIG